ncbi:hypothetical protein [Litorihabitans aurantiacus]|nr:hypothetical protein [Litorihabitans aurantiacus]
MAVNVAAQFGHWLYLTCMDLTEETFPAPPETACPDFCTTQDDPDHQWDYTGFVQKRVRLHRGVIGKTWRKQYEWLSADGRASLGHRSVGGRVR